MKEGLIVQYQFFVNGQCVFPILPPMKIDFGGFMFVPVAYWRIKSLKK